MITKIIWIAISLIWGFLGISDIISDKEIPVQRTVVAEFLIMLFAFYIGFAS